MPDAINDESVIASVILRVLVSIRGLITSYPGFAERSSQKSSKKLDPQI